MVAEQRQAYNFEVAATLAALERDGKTGSRFDVWRTLTEARRSGLVASDVTVACQRAGVAAGRDAVKLWQETIKTNMNKVAYWAARRDLCRTRNADTAQLAELADEHGAVPQDVAVVELMDRLRVRIADAKEAAAAAGVKYRKTDPVEEQKRCDTKLSAAGRRCSRHLASGTRRLFRKRKALERDPRRLPALTYQEGAVLGAGVVRLPGKVTLRLLDPNWELPQRTRWTGAVQIVDITTRVTAATKAEHRKYELIYSFGYTADGELRSRPYDAHGCWHVVGGEPSLIVFCPASQTPLGSISKNHRHELGSVVERAYLGGW